MSHDPEAKVYQIKPGISSRLAPVLSLPVGPSFHFALNDTVYSDNRIPPRGFTNAGFTQVQSQPVAYAYEDGQCWDDAGRGVASGVYHYILRAGDTVLKRKMTLVR